VQIRDPAHAPPDLVGGEPMVESIGSVPITDAALGLHRSDTIHPALASAQSG
jgi:hypothetical protein